MRCGTLKTVIKNNSSKPNLLNTISKLPQYGVTIPELPKFVLCNNRMCDLFKKRFLRNISNIPYLDISHTKINDYTTINLKMVNDQKIGYANNEISSENVKMLTMSDMDLALIQYRSNSELFDCNDTLVDYDQKIMNHFETMYSNSKEINISVKSPFVNTITVVSCPSLQDTLGYSYEKNVSLLKNKNSIPVLFHYPDGISYLITIWVCPLLSYVVGLTKH